MAGNVTRCPVANFCPYPQINVPVPSGSIWWTSSFHSSRRSSDVITADGGVASLNVPSTEIPVLPVLKPRTWPPMTPRATPP